jgi:hypothetical protein
VNLIGPAAREHVDQASREVTEEDVQVLWSRKRAVDALDAEMASPLRLLAGTGAWLAALAGVAGLTLAAWHDASVVLRAGGLVLGVALLAVGVVLGRTVARAGARVVDAFCWWTRLVDRFPTATGDDNHAAVEAVAVRAWYLHPRRMVRAGAAALAFLSPFALLSLATQPSRRWDGTWPADETLALTVAVLGVGAAGWYAGIAVFRGIARAGSAQARHDPSTRALTGRSD